MRLKLSSLDWAFGMLVFALLGLPTMGADLPEWCRWVTTGGLIICCVGNVCTLLWEDGDA